MVYDFAVTGGGIVGLSTDRALLERYPGTQDTKWSRGIVAFQARRYP